MIRTFVTAVIAIFVGFLFVSINQSFAAISSFMVFLCLESIPRLPLNRSEKIKLRAEKFLNERFHSDIKLERQFFHRQPLRFTSDVQSIYKVKCSCVNKNGFDEMWVVCGSWYLGVLNNVFKVYGIKGTDLVALE